VTGELQALLGQAVSLRQVVDPEKFDGHGRSSTTEEGLQITNGGHIGSCGLDGHQYIRSAVLGSMPVHCRFDM
jgi:hypothetical protein